MGFDTPERALDLAELESRFERPDFSSGLKRAGVKSFPGLLSRELLPLGTLHASNLNGPLHTLRHPRLSDMAARTFIIGKNAKLSKFPTPESAKIGFQNSLLRRYAGVENDPLPEAISDIAVGVMYKLQQIDEMVTLLASWRRFDPRSETLKARLRKFRSNRSIGTSISDQKLSGMGVLFGGQALAMLEGPRSLARARRISRSFRDQYHHAIPFDRSVLRAVWRNCTVEGCRKAQDLFEDKLGKINTPRRGANPRRRPGVGSPSPSEPTDTTDLSDSHTSS